jgi:hypothetical protein
MQRTEPGSSVSTVSSYALDDRAMEVRSPAEAKDVASSLCVQTGSGVHPASYAMGTGGPLPGVRGVWEVTLTTHPICCRSKKCGAIPPLPQAPPWRILEQLYITFTRKS